MAWIEFSDIIGIAIVIYVEVLAFNNEHLRKDIKNGMFMAGIFLGIIYIFDSVWYWGFNVLPISGRTDFLLNLVTCVCYIMMPLTLSTLFWVYGRRRRGYKYYAGVLSLGALVILDIVNIFHPIIFYHEESMMYYADYGPLLQSVCFVVFLILLWDMVKERAIDYDDYFLAGFVGISILIGSIGAWLDYDLNTLWESMGIAYLLMYLAVSEIYNKKDFVTGIPNRNAYEKAMSRIKNRYRSIVMIDMNGLKKYNDNMGHRMGDKYLYATAMTLADAFRGHGRIYRVGGDEFCIVSNKSGEILEEIIKSVLEEGRCKPEYGDFSISFAYGISERQDGESPFEVYERADSLMYKNKNEYKNGQGDISENVKF